MKIAGVLAGFASSLCAGEFAAPEEGPVAFRRDKVPLDADTMAALSGQLATLADGLDPKTASERRGAAQMLALSLALDPANSSARALIEKFVSGKHQPFTDADKLEKNRSLVWQTIGWLDAAEAGKEGHALAACLKDVVILSDSKDPRGDALRGAGERGAWTGWIPPLVEYDFKPPPVENAFGGLSSPDNKPVLTAARVGTPLFRLDGTSGVARTLPSLTPIRMSAVRATDEIGRAAPFFLTIGTQEGNFAELSGAITRLLEKQHGPLPEGLQVTLGVEAPETLAPMKTLQAFSAPAAVLASAAVTGREPDATVIGVVDENGAFSIPGDLWIQLAALGKGSGGRLVLPAAAADYLPSMLAMERPQFFFEYEVLLASDFKELLEMTAKTPDGALGKFSTQFREIREKTGYQAVTQYVANPFIRRRLMEIAQEVPAHQSARMLAIQGSGNRPTVIPREVLVSELRTAIKPMSWIIKHTSSTFDPADTDRIGITYEACRKAVDALLRYTDKSDRELVESVQEMVAKLRPLDRAARSRGYSYDIATAVTEARTALLVSYQEVSGRLSAGGGDQPVR